MLYLKIMNEERLDIEKALAYLTLEEKVRMLSGDGMWHTFGAGELPRVRMSDGPNGLRMSDGASGSAVPATCFPTPSMLACSWDPALLYNVGAAIGKEATAMGVNLLLAPTANVKRHPLGGRNFEYFSEDPLLTGEMSKAFVSGVQSTGVGACVKHFAANDQESMRMYSDSVVDARALREIHLKPFEIALTAKPQAVMCAYNKVNGEYCAQNEFLLTAVLRDEWGFDGVTVSDWGATRDRTASLKAGLDLAMPDSLGINEKNLFDALDAGEITESDLDRSIRRLLKLTDDVYLEPYGDFDADAHNDLAYNAAASSVVLLKNEKGFLPLTKDMRVAVCGELAENAPVQGGGSSHVTPLKSYSTLDAFSNRAIEIAYFQGYCADAKQSEKLLREAVDGTDGYDAVIVCVGQPAPSEGTDRKSMDLPPAQDRLIAELTAAGRRVVVVLFSAGPVRMTWINRVRAVLYAGLNGQCGAIAATDVIYGRINPRGKLAETFPVDLSAFEYGANRIPSFGGLTALYRESIFVGYRYYDTARQSVLFPFGHGLSFSEVSYDGMSVKRTGGAEFEVNVRLTNRSVRDAYETVQVYVSDKTARVCTPEKQLAGYMKVFIEGQTSTNATVKLSRRAFEFFNTAADKFCVADGEYEILVAASATDIKARATVKVDGDFTDDIPYPQAYAAPCAENITDADFCALYGAELPNGEPAAESEFTLDCCIADLGKTFVGRMAKRAVMRRAKSAGAPDSPERDAFIASALYTPLSAVCAMSDGAMSPNAAKGIIEMANGHFFKGVKLLLKRARD